MSITVYDKHGYPICKGDLFRSYHFGSGKGTRYLYHVAVEEKGFMWAVPTAHLEPTCASGGGKCLLAHVGEVEILSGYGPAPILEYRDRPKRQKPAE